MKGLRLFGRALKERPLGTFVGLLTEYAGYIATWCFVAILLLTRVPLALLDRAFGLRLRDRFIDLIARVSPG